MNSNNMPYNKQLISDILDEYMDDLIGVSYTIHIYADKSITLELEYDPRNIPTDPLFIDLIITYKKYYKEKSKIGGYVELNPNSLPFMGLGSDQSRKYIDMIKNDLIKKINGYGLFNRISKITSYELDDFNHHFPNSIVLRLDKEY